MNKLYTEKQYNEYCELLDEMAYEKDITICFGIYLKIKNWLKNNNITKEAKTQMEQRIEDEAMGKIPNLKRIK